MSERELNKLADLVRAYPVKGCAPLAAPDRAGRASPLSRLRRFRGVPSTGAIKLLCIIACLAIWAGTFYAIGRL